MILQPDAPSYWNMVANGLTAIPESWRYSTTRSWNHDMYAGIVEWFYRSVGGIQTRAPGYAEFIIAPIPPPGMMHANVRYESVRGPIVSNWRRDGKRFVLDVEVPANSRATVVLPVPAGDRVTESGQAIANIRAVPGGQAVDVGSGRYRFVAEQPR
jgi:alpha-L-rhamnosidase